MSYSKNLARCIVVDIRATDWDPTFLNVAAGSCHGLDIIVAWQPSFERLLPATARVCLMSHVFPSPSPASSLFLSTTSSI